MSSEWNEFRIGDLCTITSSKRIFAHDYVSIGIPFYSSKDVIDKALGTFTGACVYISEKRFSDIANKFSFPKDGDLLLSSVGNRAGIPYVIQGEGDFYFKDGNITWFKDFKSLNSEFLCYWLKSGEGQSSLNSIMIGSAQKALTISGLASLKIRIPAIAIQNEIVKVLKSLDNRIALLCETNTTLESIAQAMFKSWFVDFDPVHAKQQGRVPEGMDEVTAALFPDSFEDSELGLVPRGWRIGKLADLAVFQNGYAFKTIDWKDGGHPVVKIGSVKPGIIDISGCSYISAETTKGLEKFLLRRGDLLVGMTGYVGETGLVPNIEPSAYLNQRVGRISTKNGTLDLGFVYCLVRNSTYKNYAEERSHGSAQANVSGIDLMSYITVVPSFEVLDSFNQVLHRLIDKILTNHTQVQTLASIRDTLLPRLISGQLHLPETETLATESN
jgi:type I restriction enzyme S subunit